MCVCIYYSHRSYTKVNRGTHWYIKHKYKKFLRVTKYKLFIFMATTQLESGSFMVGMDCDCKSASMNRPLCAHMWKDPHPLQKKKTSYTTTLKISYDICVFWTPQSTLIWSNFQGTSRIYISLPCNLFQTYILFWRHCTASEALYTNQNAATADLGHAASLHLARGSWGELRCCKQSVVSLFFSSFWLYWYALTVTVP